MMAAAHLVAEGRPVRLSYALGWYARRGLRLGMWVMAGLLVAAAVLPIVVIGTGYRPLVVRTGDMQPALATGDVMITEVVPPAEVRVGDIVTVADAYRGGALITQRVVEVRKEDHAYHFATKGDAGSVEERWSVDGESGVGRLSYRIPRLGYALTLTTTPAARNGVLAIAGLAFLGVLARRVWVT